MKSVPQLDPWELNKGIRGATSSAVAGVILVVLHALTFLPIVLIIALQNVYLKLAVVLNTALCICLAAGSLCFHHMGIVKVFPKMLDTFLLLFYVSTIPVVYTQSAWLAHWMNVFHHGSVAAFMWLSLLLPCWDNFVLEALKDKLPDHLWQLPSSKRCALQAARGWTGALTAMALLALAPALTGRDAMDDPVHIVCDYVLPLLLVLGAWACRIWLVKRAVAAAHGWQAQHDAEVGVAVAAVPAGTSATFAQLHATVRAGGSQGLGGPGEAGSPSRAEGSCDSNLSSSLHSSSGTPIAAGPGQGPGNGASRLLWLLRPVLPGRKQLHAAAPAADASAC